MKKITTIILLILLFSLVVSPAGAMIGGEPDTEHTNVGAIVMYWPQFGITGRLCSATLIHPRVMVTAAHCYTYVVNQEIETDQIWVTFDPDAVAEGATYLEVEAFIPHPDFNFQYADTHDIALVILKEEAPEGIQLEPLPEEGYLDQVIGRKKGQQNFDLVVVGYGSNTFLLPPENQMDSIRRTGTVNFQALGSFEIRHNPESATLCLGDSGGPIFYLDHKGNEVQVGLYSRGGNDQCVSGGFHYRLDTESAQDFIEDTIAAYFSGE